MYFYCFCVFHREFLWPTRCQMSFNFNISYHRHQGLLECQTFVTYHALSNASCSIYLFLAQWRLVLSESAVYLLTSCLWLFTTSLTLYHKIHELFYLWCQTKLELQEKLCNKCPGGNSTKTAVLVIILAISGFTSNDRAPGGPVTTTLPTLCNYGRTLMRTFVFASCEFHPIFIHIADMRNPRVHWRI